MVPKGSISTDAGQLQCLYLAELHCSCESRLHCSDMDWLHWSCESWLRCPQELGAHCPSSPGLHSPRMLVVGLYCPNMAGLHCLGTELHCSDSVELHCSDNVGPHPAVGARDHTGGENGDAPSHYDHYHALGHLLPDSQASGYLPCHAHLQSPLTSSYSSRQ